MRYSSNRQAHENARQLELPFGRDRPAAANMNCPFASRGLTLEDTIRRSGPNDGGWLVEDARRHVPIIFRLSGASVRRSPTRKAP